MMKDSDQDADDNKPTGTAPFDFLFKIVIGGSGGVGKTCLLQRYNNGQFQDNYIATTGVDFIVIKTETKNGDRVKVEAWDLAGQQRFSTLSSSYYRGASGILLVYDVTDRSSFNHISSVLGECRTSASEDIVIFLVGNKAEHTDSKREVTYEEGKSFAEEHGLPFHETSARDNVNVNEVFEQFVEAVVEAYKKARADGYSGYQTDQFVEY